MNGLLNLIRGRGGRGRGRTGFRLLVQPAVEVHERGLLAKQIEGPTFAIDRRPGACRRRRPGGRGPHVVLSAEVRLALWPSRGIERRRRVRIRHLQNALLLHAHGASRARERIIILRVRLLLLLLRHGRNALPVCAADGHGDERRDPHVLRAAARRGRAPRRRRIAACAPVVRERARSRTGIHHRPRAVSLHVARACSVPLSLLLRGGPVLQRGRVHRRRGCAVRRVAAALRRCKANLGLE